MTEIGLFEAKNKLSELVERASRGEEIVVLKRGKAKARLVAMGGVGDHEVSSALSEIERFRRSLTHRASIEELIADKNYGRR